MSSKSNPKSELQLQSFASVLSANISLLPRPQLVYDFLWGALSAHVSEFRRTQASSGGACYRWERTTSRLRHYLSGKSGIVRARTMSSLIENPIGMNTDLVSVEKSLVALRERLTFLK